ncbi:MAG: MFS transporter [Coprobacillaceae bacterium]
MLENWKKNVTVFMTSQMISLLGSSLVQYAITWYIMLETKSGLYSAIAMVCGFLPIFILSPIAGVWADRYSRKTLIMVADGGIAVTTLLLAILFLIGYREIWILFVALVIRGIGSAIQSPCVNAVLPDIVPEEQLSRINGMNSSIQAIANLVCPMASGALLSVASMEAIFFIDVITAALAIIIMMKYLYLPKAQKPSEEVGTWSSFKEGVQYAFSKKYLKVLFVCMISLWIVAGPMMSLPALQVVRVFGDKLWYLTAVETASGVGMIAGALLISVWKGFKSSIVTMAAALVVMGGAVVMMGFPTYFMLYLVMAVVMYGMLSIFNTLAITFLQKKIDKEYIGRVFGMTTMFSSSLMPLGMLVFGPLADIIAIEYILIACGIVVILVAGSIGMSTTLKRAEA